MLFRRYSACSGCSVAGAGELLTAAFLVAVLATPARALICGDGILDAGEQCDTGSLVGTGFAATGQCAEATFATQGNDADCRLLNGSRRLDCRKKN